MNVYSVSSIIENDVSLGDGTRIWYFSHIMEGARLGRDCNIAERVFIGKKVIIGDNVRIGNDSKIFEGAIIKNNTRIGCDVRITNVRKPHSTKKARKFQTTLIGENVVIDAGSTIEGGVTIGDGAIIGKNSMVLYDVPENTFVCGNPAKIKEELNKLNG